MCLSSKVANPRDFGDYVRYPATGGDEGGASSKRPLPCMTAAEATVGEAAAVFSGYRRSREMTAMVTALTHVVSGQRQQDRGETTSFGNSPPPSSVYSSSSSDSWGGQKRGREEESGTGSQYSEQQQFQRIYRWFSDFRGESSSVSTGDWTSQLEPDSRQRMVDKLMDTLKRLVPSSGQKGLQELKKIAKRFEEKIYTSATSQPDYLKKISLKILIVVMNYQNITTNSLPSTCGNNSKIPPDAGVKPTKSQWSDRLRQRESTVDDTSSSKKQSQSVKGGTLRNTSRGGFAESNVDVNTAGGRTFSKKRSTSVIGKRKIKIKKPCSTEPTNENEGEVHETAFRSSLRGIITLIKELDLRNCHKEVLKKTPFWGIFEAIIENKLTPKQCRKSDKMIIEIINTYDSGAKVFRLGRESMELTRADMVSVFGISCGNKSVDLKYCPKEKVKLVKRREISEPRLTSKSLKQLLEKYLGGEEKDDIEDVARLLCLYLFHTFLFPTGPTIKWVYLERIENLDRFRDYDWNEAIINELMSSIKKYHGEPRKVTGCVMALLYWLCEHTNLSQALHPEHPLGIGKWSIPVVVSKFKKTSLKDLEPSQVVSRQANVAGTADDEAPVDKDIMQDSVSSGDVPVSNQGNDACSEAGFQCDEALPSLSNSPDCDNERTAFTDMGIPQLKRDILPSNQALEATVDTNNVWVKARCVNGNIKFRLYWPWRMAELEQEVKKRLKFEAEAYSINYKDEFNELILIACDEDLEECISSSKALGTNPIEVFLELK